MTTTNIQSFFGNVEVAGTLNVTGTLTSDTGVDKVALATSDTNASHSVIFSSGTSGSQSLKTGPGITYNPSTNKLTVAGDISSSGNVGIGTTDPNYKLDVAGSANVHALTATTGTFSGDLAVGTSKLFVDVSTSNVGIGTTSPTSSLHVVGTSNVGALTATTGTFTGALTATTGAFSDVLKLGGGSTTGDNNVDSGNKTNTYIRFGEAGTATDWAYLRQIGGSNEIKLALDFHDDNEARFEIRKNHSTSNPDAVTTVFAVDDGAVSATSFSGAGSGLTTLNASNISSGTLDKARLPTTINNTTIEDTGSAILTIHDSSDDNQAAVLYETTTYTWKAGLHGGGDGKFKISKDDFETNDYLVIDTSGQVGIGTDTPTSNLHVVGTANVGDLTATTVTATTVGTHYGLISGSNAITATTGTFSGDVTGGSFKLNGGGGTSIDIFDDYVDVNPYTYFRNSNDNDASYFNFLHNYTSVTQSGSGPNDEIMSLQLQSINNGTTDVDTRVYIPGRLSINTSNFDYKLNVNGTVNTGALTTTSIGIGTTAGSYKLNVNGAANTAALTATTGTFSGDLTVGTANLFVDVSTSNVGIGTNTPLTMLHVKGSTIVGTVADNYQTELKSLYFVRGATRTSSGLSDRHHYITTQTDGYAVGNKMSFYIDDGSTTNGSSHINALTLVGDGNVGIGTTDPAYKLDVHGTSNVGTLTATSATVPNDGDFVMGGKPLKPAAGLYWDRVNSRLGVGLNTPQFAVDINGIINAKGLYVDSIPYSASPWRLNNGHVYFITANVGIGTTTPTSNLHVVGNAYVSSDLTVDGNVGIGTTSPLSTFTITTDYSGGESSGLCLDSTDSGGTVYNFRLYSFVQSSRNVGWKFRVNNDTSSVDALTLGSTGNVGIGTASPSYTLDVSGTLRHTGLAMSAGKGVDQIKEITKTLQLSTSWQDTGITATDLDTGSHVVQIYDVSNSGEGGGNYQETYTGMMSWFSGTTNSTEGTEIPMTAAGHAPNNRHIYLQVKRSVTPGKCKLQIRSDVNHTASYAYEFKFRKLI